MALCARCRVRPPHTHCLPARAGMNFLLPLWPDPETPLNNGNAFDEARHRSRLRGY